MSKISAMILAVGMLAIGIFIGLGLGFVQNYILKSQQDVASKIIPELPPAQNY